MKNAVIFDVDGTLVDSVDLHAEAWHEAFHHFGFEIATAAIRTQIGKGGDKLMLFSCRNGTWKKRAKRSKNTEANCSCVNTCPKFGAFRGCESYSKESGQMVRRLRWPLRPIRSSSPF